MTDRLNEVQKIINGYFDSVDSEAFGRFRADFSFGKMLRSKLLLSIAPNSPTALRVCAIIELIHFASLLHDDVIDSANLRRGKQSINAKYGDKNAIMLGDILYSKAFYEVACIPCVGANLSQIISNAVFRLSLGELDDVFLGESINLDDKKYLKMVERKTGALIEASAVCGGILKNNLSLDSSNLSLGLHSADFVESSLRGSLSDSENNEAIQKNKIDCHDSAFAESRNDEYILDSAINKYRIYGRNLGIAFQIIDDLLDITQEDSTLGKESFSDFKEGKTTLPYIYLYNALNASDKEILKSYFKKSLDSTQKSWIRAKMGEFEIIQKVKNIAQDYGKMALSVLDSGDKSDKNLQKIITDMIDREF